MAAAPQRLGDEDRLRLSVHPILRDLHDEVRDELIEQFHVVDVGADEHILEEGGLNSRLFIVLRGTVSVRLPKHGGRISEVKLATLGAPETFGEYSLFDGQKVSAAVYAAETSRIAWLDKSAIDRLIDHHPQAARRFYEAVIRILVSRLRARNAELDIITVG
jgi:CRP-like cAMP-binding protein